MPSLQEEVAAFLARKDAAVVEARQRVALQLACGIDLPDFHRAEEARLAENLARIKRALQRERMKAAQAHWSYDLNRHIALKQAHDELQRSLGQAGGLPSEGGRKSRNGARRRRSGSI